MEADELEGLAAMVAVVAVAVVAAEMVALGGKEGSAEGKGEMWAAEVVEVQRSTSSTLISHDFHQ